MITTASDINKRPFLECARRRAGMLACAVLSLGLSACATTTDFSSWAVGYNTSVEQARNQLMLLNIVRASEDMPLLFTGIQVVRGNGQNTAGTGLGGTRSVTSNTVPGALASTSVTNALAPSVSLQVSSGFNFDVMVIDSAEFLQGLLTPVSVLTFNHYARQGIPTELLMHLLVEKITITTTTPTGMQTVTYRNEPLGQDYKSFRIALAALVQNRITTEVGSSASEAIGPLLTDDDLKAGRSTELSKSLPGLFLQKVPGGYRFYRPGGMVANFCFLGEEKGQTTLPQSSLCADSPLRKAKQMGISADTAGKNVLNTVEGSMTVELRSTNGVFDYLGDLVRYQTEFGGDIINLNSPEAIAYRHQGKNRSLFRVAMNRPQQYDIAAVEYRGKMYSLPLEEQGYSATVLQVLNQLFSLSKSVNAIPAAGTVVVR